MTTQSTSWVGLVIGRDRYHIVAGLGEGGMGRVYRARDCHLDCDVVIKVPRLAMLENPEFAGRFAREVRSLVRLAHPHIVKVLDVGEHEGLPFAVMQYLSGGGLRERYEGGHEPRRMPSADLGNWLGPVAAALDFIHKEGYIHRDVKPDNILFDGHGHVYLSDFGIAKALGRDDLLSQNSVRTENGMVLGTPRYMAPEMILGEAFDQQVDQYALAATVYEIMTGRTPYDGRSLVSILQQHIGGPPTPLASLVPGISPALAAAVHKGLAKLPKQRHASCSDFARAALGSPSTLAHAPTEAHGPQPTPAPTQPPTPTTTCPTCGKVLRIPANLQGSKVRCPACHAPILTAGTLPLMLDKAAVTRMEEQAHFETPRGPVPAPLGPSWQPHADTQRPAAPQPAKSSSFVGIVVLVALLVATSLVLLWASGVFRVRTKDGVLVVEVNEPNPDVYVDGEKVTVTWDAGGKKAEISVKPGTKEVRVAKDGFAAFGEKVTLEEGGRKVITARLEKTAPGVASITPPETAPVRPPETLKAKTMKAPPVSTRAGPQTSVQVTVPPTVVVKAGERTMLPIKVQRQDVKGPVAIRLEGLPAKVTVTKPGTLAADQDAVQLELAAGLDADDADTLVRVVATLGNVTGEATTTVKVTFPLGEIRHFKKRDATVFSVAISPDGRRALSGDLDGVLYLWDMVQGGEPRRLSGHDGRIYQVAISPDGRWGLSGGADRTVRVWDLDSPSEEPRRAFPIRQLVTGVAFSADSRRVLAVGNVIHQWELEAGNPLLTYTYPDKKYPWSSAYSPRGRQALTGGTDGNIYLWDTDTGNTISRLEGHAGTVSSLCFAADGRRALSTGQDSTLYLWDLDGVGRLRTFDRQLVQQAVLSRDGRRILSADPGNTVVLLDADTGKEVQRFPGHTEYVQSLGMSANRRLAVSGGNDGTVRFWGLPK